MLVEQPENIFLFSIEAVRVKNAFKIILIEAPEVIGVRSSIAIRYGDDEDFFCGIDQILHDLEWGVHVFEGLEANDVVMLLREGLMNIVLKEVHTLQLRIIFADFDGFGGEISADKFFDPRSFAFKEYQAITKRATDIEQGTG